MTSFDELLERHQQEIDSWVRDVLVGALDLAGLHDGDPLHEPDRHVPTYRAYRAIVGNHDILLSTEHLMVSTDWFAEKKGPIFGIQVPRNLSGLALHEKMAHLLDHFLGGGDPIELMVEAISFMEYKMPVEVELSWSPRGALVEVKAKSNRLNDFVATTSVLSYVSETEKMRWAEFQKNRSTLALGVGDGILG